MFAAVSDLARAVLAAVDSSELVTLVATEAALLGVASRLLLSCVLKEFGRAVSDGDFLKRPLSRLPTLFSWTGAVDVAVFGFVALIAALNYRKSCRKWRPLVVGRIGTQ